LDIGYWILDIPIVLTPNTRTTWTLDIGYWLLDILQLIGFTLPASQILTRMRPMDK
jgi:hypothetical protein